MSGVTMRTSVMIDSQDLINGLNNYDQETLAKQLMDKMDNHSIANLIIQIGRDRFRDLLELVLLMTIPSPIDTHMVEQFNKALDEYENSVNVQKKLQGSNLPQHGEAESAG